MKNSLRTALWIGSALLVMVPSSRAQELPQSGLFATYQDSGLQTTGNKVTGWKSSPVTQGKQSDRILDRIVGTPRAMTVQTPSGKRNVLSLDGSSSLWGAVQSWGSLEGERTIMMLVRLEPNAQGTLFDGSTLVGLSRAQVKDGVWQVGSSKGVAPTLSSKFGAWQLHTFTFRPQFGAMTVAHSVDGQSKTVDAQQSVPQGGFIVGTDATRANGLKAQVGEILIYNRALPESEVQKVGADIQKRWGALTSLPAPEAMRAPQGALNTAEGDRAAIAAKLADTSKPLIWLWSGDSAGEQGEGDARGVAENFAERVRWEKNRRRDFVIDQTAPGLDATTISTDFETRIGRFKPAVVVLSPTGQASDAAQLETLIERVRATGAIPILQANGKNTALVQSVAQSQNVLLVQSGTVTPAALSLGLFDALGLNDNGSATVKQLSR